MTDTAQKPMIVAEDETLLPCPNPWCGEGNVRLICWDLYQRRVICTCGVKGPRSSGGGFDANSQDKIATLDSEAIRLWNSRAQAARIEELEAVIKALLDLEGNTSPFAGEMQRDRVERTINNARALIAKETQ